MNVKQGLPAWTQIGRALKAGDRHEVIIVAIAVQRKPPIGRARDAPRIALRRWDELPLVRNRPRQAQARQRSFHCTDNRQGAVIVTAKPGRIGDEAEEILRAGIFSTNP
jgi:hypothetical protein